MTSTISDVTTVTGSLLNLNQYLTNNNILGFAVKNHRDRFLIPSNQNSYNDNDSSSTKIQCSLHSDIKEFQFQLPYIRFSLDRQSIKILAETDIIPFSDVDKETIKDILKFLDDFINHFPSMVNNKKRDYCLLGQHFLRNVGSIQLNKAIIFIDEQKLREKSFSPNDKSINEIVNFLFFQRPKFARTEQFLVCEDNEHGGKDLLNK
ncbi:unnamed protein product [Rotaria sordida]|uniref:Uncharacterized protein n=1 Tax=Rotaria sordida TaxID=392033 RepID=A0A814WZN3_9BILA|nr:unnamed protein product [Rotaria sordida]CAF3820678.1 unnamed protein product [Rotaria sordida]